MYLCIDYYYHFFFFFYSFPYATSLVLNGFSWEGVCPSISVTSTVMRFFSSYCLLKRPQFLEAVLLPLSDRELKAELST